VLEARRNLIVVIRQLVFLHYCQLWGRVTREPTALELMQTIYDSAEQYYYNAIINRVNSIILGCDTMRPRLIEAAREIEDEINPEHYPWAKHMRDVFLRMSENDVPLYDEDYW
jgi:hypothetical protein